MGDNKDLNAGDVEIEAFKRSQEEYAKLQRQLQQREFKKFIQKHKAEIKAKLEASKKSEDEHFRLQRQMKVIQATRSNINRGIHPIFRRQDNLLRALKREYRNIALDIKIANSGFHKKYDKRMKKDLKNALLMRKLMRQHLIEHDQMIKQFEGLIRKEKKNVVDLKKATAATIGEEEERRTQSASRLASMENRLEAEMLKFNVIQAENSKMRDEIEVRLKDREIFTKDWTRMLSALCKGKKFLQDLFESSHVAYDQRDEWCTKLRYVQEKGKMDQLLQMQEMRDLQKCLDHEKGIFDFLAQKGVIRINKKQERKDAEEKIKSEEDKKRQIEEHEKILNDVMNYTNIHDIDKIIDEFKFTEHNNFSVYKLLTDTCAENESLRRSLNRVRDEMEKRRDWNEMKQNMRDTKIEYLKEKLESVRTEREDLETKLDEQKRQIDNTFKTFKEMFESLHCSREIFENRLGDQPNIWCMREMLSLVTQKIQEQVQMVYFTERNLKKDRSQSRLKKFTVHMEPMQILEPTCVTSVVREPCSICIEARWFSRVVEGKETPFDHEMALAAIKHLADDPAYCTSDRLHQLADCRLPKSRLILAKRYNENA